VGNEPLDPPLKNAHNQAEAVAQHGQGPEGASTWQRP
jgi:hypothetical protein